MPRIRLNLPERFNFVTTIPIRITDLNYGNHVGNDSILSIIHEARMQFLGNYGYTEMQFGGTGMIMSDVEIEFKNEVFYGDQLIASVTATAFSKVSFSLYYKLEIKREDRLFLVAIAKTGMVCYDYEKKKIVPVPNDAKEKLCG